MTDTGNKTFDLRVLLADDHRMLLDMFSAHLAQSAGITVQTAENLEEALLAMEQVGPFDVVLLDLHMPGMNGVAGLRRAARANQGRPVGIITGSPTPRMTRELISAGAAGIVLKTTPLRRLATAIRFMSTGEIYAPVELFKRLGEGAQRVGEDRLSPKEAIVLEYLAQGMANKAIGLEMHAAEQTVKMHVSSICRKLGAQNRTHAVIIARDLGLI